MKMAVNFAHADTSSSISKVKSLTDAQIRRAQDRRLFANNASSSDNTVPERAFSELSDFIASGKSTTFVPANAILFIPDKYRDHVVEEPEGNLVMWKDFLRMNRSLVDPFEVTLKQASGAEIIDPEEIEAATKKGRIIVAVLRGFPTSVSKNGTKVSTLKNTN